MVLPAKLGKSAPSAPPASSDRPTYSTTDCTRTVSRIPAKIAEDAADVYLNRLRREAKARPVALMLPGALVGRTHYSQFATLVACQGFAVIVPTHVRTVPEFKLTGELAEASQILATLAWVEQETANPKSRFYRLFDPARMALLGHSHGGFVGLQAIANTCLPFFCQPPFARPKAVKVGVFYGVNSQDPTTGKFSPTANANIPIALVQGSQDGVATPEEAVATYNLIATPPKALITIEGANHYGITNLNNPAGARPDKSTPTLEQAQGIEMIAQWTVTFLRAHLYQDAVALKQIYGSNQSESSVTIQSRFK